VRSSPDIGQKLSYVRTRIPQRHAVAFFVMQQRCVIAEHATGCSVATVTEAQLRTFHVWLGDRTLCDRFSRADAVSGDGFPMCGACYVAVGLVEEIALATAEASKYVFHPSPAKSLALLQETSWGTKGLDLAALADWMSETSYTFPESEDET